MMTCPTLLQQRYVYGPSKGKNSFNSWNEFLQAVNDGDIESVCVAAGGTTSDCQSATLGNGGDKANCVGPYSNPFERLDDKECDAVWGGAFPPGDQDYAKDFNSVSLPNLRPLVSVFRQTDLADVSGEGKLDSSKTTLEIAATRAFQSLVGDGTWQSVFGNIRGVDESGFCGGEEYWPLPETDAVEVSDLRAVLNRGTFRW